MSEIEPLKCRQKPIEAEFVRFPNGGNTQFRISQWIKSHGATTHLWDGWVKERDEPADDGSMYQWTMMSLRDHEDNWKTAQSVFVGDYIVHHGDGDFKVIKPWDFDRNYEEIDDA